MDKKKRGRVWPKKEIIIHKDVIECNNPKMFVREFIELLEDVKEKSVIEEYLESKQSNAVSQKPKSKPGPKPKTKTESKVERNSTKPGRVWPEKKVVAYIELKTTKPKVFERELKAMINRYDNTQKEMLVDII